MPKAINGITWTLFWSHPDWGTELVRGKKTALERLKNGDRSLLKQVTRGLSQEEYASLDRKKKKSRKRVWMLDASGQKHFVADYTGVQYGRFTALRLMYVNEKNTHWECLCSCGKKFVACIHGRMRKSRKMPGCKECRKVTHGHTRGHKMTRTYGIWCGMKDRCYNSKVDNYSNYGGRGITVCDRWIDNFEAFLEDMGECPKGMSIDRRNVNGDYCPENCRYATAETQSNNRRSNLVFDYDGVRGTLKQLVDWCSHFAYATVYRRIREGWPIDFALKAPLHYEYTRNLDCSY